MPKPIVNPPTSRAVVAALSHLRQPRTIARFATTVILCGVALGTVSCKKDPTDRSSLSASPILSQLQRGIRNVVLISIDTLRADHLGCYGHDFVNSPNIDALAATGILFETNFSAASTTLASHTSMFTGTYPHTHGVPHNGQIVGDKNVMLPEVLGAAGFKTAGFVAAAPLDNRVNFSQGFDHYDADFRLHKEGSTEKRSQRRADEVTDSVLTWLDAESADGSKEAAPTDRLFLFVHYFDVHWPYDAPPPYSRMYRKDSLDVDGSMETIKHTRSELRLGYRGRRSGTGNAAIVGGWPCSAEAPSNPIHRSRWDEGVRLAKVLDAEYCAEITYCDHHVGRLLDGLKARGLFEDSLIILTSDHGETMHEHDNVFNHGVSVYDTEIHTPLLIRFPGGVSAGKRVSHLVSAVDLVPTILELLNLPIMDNLEGESFARIVDGPLPTRAPVFAEATRPRKIKEFDEDPIWTNRGKFQCVRTERYKYMFRIPDQVFRFFDLSVDPLEQTNLLLPQHKHDASIVAELRVLLTAWRDDAHPIGSRPSESKDHLEALRALGYVGDDSEDTEGIESPDADAP